MAVYLCACSTTYKFVTEPDGAVVYHQANGGNALLGTAPLEFSKSSLPEDTPFVVIFEKPGYESLHMVVTPTDGAHTIVRATLKPGKGGKDDPGLARTRTAVGRIFKVQEFVAARRYVDALTLLKELETKEPDMAEVYVLKGSIYVKLNDPQQAREAWTKALALDSSLDVVRVHLDKLRESAQAGSTP